MRHHGAFRHSSWRLRPPCPATGGETEAQRIGVTRPRSLVRNRWHSWSTRDPRPPPEPGRCGLPDHSIRSSPSGGLRGRQALSPHTFSPFPRPPQPPGPVLPQAHRPAAPGAPAPVARPRLSAASLQTLTRAATLGEKWGRAGKKISFEQLKNHFICHDQPPGRRLNAKSCWPSPSTSAPDGSKGDIRSAREDCTSHKSPFY